MDSDFVVGINKSIDAAKGETGQTYPAYLHNTLVTKKLDELAEAITEGGGASALSDLTDVDISGTVQGGKVLKYNAVEEKWAPGDDSGNVQSDWNESDPASGAYILNKPDISNIISGTTDPAANIGDNGDIYLKKELVDTQEQIDINYSHAYDGRTTTITVLQNDTVIYTNTVNNVQQGDLDERYAGFDEVTTNVTSLGGVTFIFKYRGVAVNNNNPTCFFTSFNNGEETGWTMTGGNSSFASNVTRTFNVPSGLIVSEILLKDNNKWITYKQDQVQADWDESDSSDPSYIQNKPTIPSDLDDLSDVDLTNLQNGMTLKYNSGTLKFEAGVLYIEILQADYDQLTYDQKHNGIPYFITDGQGAASLPSYVDLTDILTAGNTTLTIQSPYITTAGTYDIYTDPEVPYNSKVVTAGQIVITFDAQSSDLAVKVRIT